MDFLHDIAELFRDARFVVLDKPPGLPVHAGPRGGPSVEDWFPRLSRRRTGPWLAHRLDADTSGCLVVALRRAALHEAQQCFAEGRAEKVYWAVVHGGPVGNAGVVDAPLLKRTGPGGWRMAVDPAGQAAQTDWVVRGHSRGQDSGQGSRLTWLELRPRTGRTHQVRVHCAALGCPLVGDPVYGSGDGQLQLLARAVRLPLAAPVEATAPPPAHMRDRLRSCGWDGRAA